MYLYGCLKSRKLEFFKMFVCLVRSCQIIAPYCTSGKLIFCDGKSPCLMDKSTISMAMFNSEL